MREKERERGRKRKRGGERKRKKESEGERELERERERKRKSEGDERKWYWCALSYILHAQRRTRAKSDFLRSMSVRVGKRRDRVFDSFYLLRENTKSFHFIKCKRIDLIFVLPLKYLKSNLKNKMLLNEYLSGKNVSGFQ